MPRKCWIQVGLIGYILIVVPVFAGFQALPATLSAGVSPRGLALGDPFGRGSPSVIVANFGAANFVGQVTDPTKVTSQDSNLQIFSASPAGLRLEVTVPTALNPRGVLLLDIDQDGEQEILVTAYGADLLQVFSRRNGSFVKVEEEPTLKMPVGLAAGRIEPDGPVYVGVADFGSNQVSIFQIEGSSLVRKEEVPVGRGPVQLGFLDVDGDGDKEMIVACLNSGRLDILDIGKGRPTVLSRSLFLSEGSLPSDLKVVDLDRDGRDDLVVTDFAKNGVWIFLQKEKGVLSMQPFLGTSGIHPNGSAIVDLDQNGTRAILVPGRDSDTIDIFRSKGGAFHLSETLRTAEGPEGPFGPVELGILDADNDGRVDIVTTHMRSGSLKVFSGNKNGGYVKTLLGPSEGEPAFAPETTWAQPNPSRVGNVQFNFSLEGPTAVTIRVFDITGTTVWSKELGAPETHSGENKVLWTCVNQQGTPVASGLYLYRITVQGRSVTKKISILH